MKEGLVSIVIPAYNEEHNIKACLESINNQDYIGPKEIIVVDNNSADKTAEIAKELGVKVIFERQVGVIFAREVSTKAAQGEIIVQTDADTTFPNNWLSNIMTSFSKDKDIIAVIGSFKFFDGPWWGKVFVKIIFGVTNIIYRLTGRLVYIPGSNTAFKKKNWHGYNLKLDQGGDEVALLKELNKEKGKIVFLRNNFVLTSARRLEKGLLYNIFVILIFYYIFDFTYRKITGKSIIDPFPKTREKEEESSI